MVTDEMIRIMEAEIDSLKKALKNYVACRHGGSIADAQWRLGPRCIRM